MPNENTNNNSNKNTGHGGFVSGSYQKSVAFDENEANVYSMPKNFFEELSGKMGPDLVKAIHALPKEGFQKIKPKQSELL